MKTIDDFCSAPQALDLDKLAGMFGQGIVQPPHPSSNSLSNWKMERDDAPIFEYLYKVFAPRRHLEFGTWQGWGATLCLESCKATVWTLNLPDGESKSDGTWAYGERVKNLSNAPNDIVSVNYGTDDKGPVTYHRTDAGGYIGHIYRSKNLGHRVCQVYCDSREWDVSNYPADFFDSVLIDGGHQPEVVISDTRKALKVLRSGGLIMWHDFCPVPEIRTQFASAKGVTEGIGTILSELETQLESLHWIRPSWILIGVKK